MKLKKLMMISLIIISFPLIGHTTSNVSADSKQTATTEKKPLYWVDTMEPDVHYSAPGKSKMGMVLVPVYPGDKQDKKSGSSSSAKD